MDEKLFTPEEEVRELFWHAKNFLELQWGVRLELRQLIHSQDKKHHDSQTVDTDPERRFYRHIRVAESLFQFCEKLMDPNCFFPAGSGFHPPYRHWLAYTEIDADAVRRFNDILEGWAWDTFCTDRRIEDHLSGLKDRLLTDPSELSRLSKEFIELHELFEIIGKQSQRSYDDLVDKSDSRLKPLERIEVVSLAKDHVALQGTLFTQLPDGSAAFCQALIDANGNWISAKKICETNPQLKDGTALYRIRSRMPKPFQDLIEARRGKGGGFRLKLE